MVKLFQIEETVHSNNILCKAKIASMFISEWNKTQAPINDNNSLNGSLFLDPTLQFKDIADKLTRTELNKIRNNLSKTEIEAFVKVRSQNRMRAGNISYIDVPKNKPELFDKVWELHNVVVLDRRYPTCPQLE